MKILVANHWLEKLGGSETFTYTLAGELVKQGHQVDLFTFRPGMVSERIRKDFGIGMKLKCQYDLILANHHTCVEKVSKLGYTIQTCHGIFPKLEQPSANAHKHVSISEEVQDHLKKMGFESDVILNGIDQTRFRYSKPAVIPKMLLSMVHSDQANAVVRDACRMAKIEFRALNKYKNATWEVEKIIKQADIVVSLGRGAYEAMSSARAVIVYDSRKYFDSCGDGYLTLPGLFESIRNNCSGRRYRFKFDASSLADEIRLYHPSDAESLCHFAKYNLDIEKQVKKYLNLYEQRN